jgi:hypothetical protein
MARGIATTIYLTSDLYLWLKSRTIHEVDESGKQLSMTKVITRYCEQARARIEQAERFISVNDGTQIERETGR